MNTNAATVIPAIADRVANCENIVSIDLIAETQKYFHIVAWGKFLGFTPASVCRSISEAESDSAPHDSIQKINGRWLRLEDIRNQSNRQRVAELVAQSGMVQR